MKKVYFQNAKYINIPGFRKGKAPMNIVEKYYGAEIFYEDAFNEVATEAYDEAIDTNKIDVVSRPTVDIVQMEKGKDVIFTAVVQVKPEVELGKYKGIGVEIDKSRVITKIMKNSPAESSGLEVGDKFISVDGTALNDTNGTAVGALIRSTEKESVDIVIERSGEQMSFNVKIDTIEEPAIAYEALDNNIGYLNIQKFSRPLTSQVETALNELEEAGIKKLIIDLRNNSGGYLDSAETTASLFLKKGKLIYSLENKDKKEDYYDKTDTSREYPIVILINEKSASSAEILAAALKDSYGAILVGEKSYGKGKVQQTIDLEDGSMAKYTSARWLRPNGDCIDETGLIPDYIVSLTYERDENGNEIATIDSQKNKAIEIIGAM